jgi:hypothetical protein
VSAKPCEDCRQLFAASEDDKKFADILEERFPECQCECYSVGEGSPGPIAGEEVLHRIIVSPRDYDPDSDTIRGAPFEKVFANGLSVCRGIATDAEVTALVEEGLVHTASEPSKQVWAICEVVTSDIRAMRSNDNDRLFCVYDQTVSRTDKTKPPIPTHAGVFLRWPPKSTQDRKILRKDFAGRLREKFIAKTLKVDAIRNGLFCTLNERAKAGEFRSEGIECP